MTPAFTLLGALTVAVLLYAAHRRYGLPGVGKAQTRQLPRASGWHTSYAAPGPRTWSA